MKVSRVNEMRELDRKAIERFGIPEMILMENAGLAVFQALAEHYPLAGKRFAVFCGSGNNGGDGLVVARKIHSNGGKVTVFLLGNADKFRGASRQNYETALALSLEVYQVEDSEVIRRYLSEFGSAGEMAESPDTIIVDAIFGTGLERPVSGLYADVIELINTSRKPVISVDIPSGVNGDTGEVMGTAVRADLTVTFGLPKLGNLLYPGSQLCGELLVSHISFPPELTNSPDLHIAVNEPQPLPPRKVDGHKGDFGQALFIAGAKGYYGAPALAALSFLKAGGGYSRLAAPASVIPFIAARSPEIVFLPQAETAAGSLALEAKEILLQAANRLDFTVLGPGISLNSETVELARRLAAEITKPLLIDGDGITAVCASLDILRQRTAPTILTPHLGEMSRLTGLSMADIRSRPVDILQETAAGLNAVIVLKGAHSLIGLPGGEVWINLSGNSGMATAGSGDVLAGTIAAMAGLGLPAAEAVRKGVFLHGLAGDLAAAAKGEDGITAVDIMEWLPHAVWQDRKGIDPALQKRYTLRVIG